MFQKITTSSKELKRSKFHAKHAKQNVSSHLNFGEKTSKHLEIKFPYSYKYDPIIEVISSFFIIIIL